MCGRDPRVRGTVKRRVSPSAALRCGLLLVLISGMDASRALPADGGVTLRMLSPSKYLRFNRVEGLYLGAGASLEKMTEERTVLGVRFSAGYAFAAEKERHEMTGYLARVRDARSYALMTVSVYDDTDCLGPRRTGLGSNSFSSLLFKEDYLDYYGRKGLEIELTERYRAWKLTVGGRSERDYSLSADTQGSLSGIDRGFRSNPSIDGGRLHSVAVGAGFDGSEIPGVYPRGHSHEVELTMAGGEGLGGDFEYTRFDGSTSWFLRGLWSQLLSVHGYLGVSRDSLPAQSAFYLGGPGSLRGFPVNELRGNHYWLLSVEHYLPYRPFMPLRFQNPFFYALRPIVFADAGSVWTASRLWAGAETKTHSDIGVGVGDTDNIFRIDCAWPVDEKMPSPTWTIQFDYRW
jgi:hypothetical protein